MAGMWGVASVAGPVVGGWFTDHLSWTFVFWINVPLGLAAMWLCNRALKLLPARGVGGKIDYLGAVLLTGGVVACLLVLSWGGSEYPWLSPELLLLTALSIALFAALIWHERRAPDPILPPRMFSDAVFTRGVILAFLSSVGLLGATFLLPALLPIDPWRGRVSLGAADRAIPRVHRCRRLRWRPGSRAVLAAPRDWCLPVSPPLPLGFAGLALTGPDTPAAPRAGVDGGQRLWHRDLHAQRPGDGAERRRVA